MFADLINQAKEAASHLTLIYLARASVAVPFVIALGFALAAIAVMLVQRFGHASTYWIMAGGLAAIGVVAAIAVSVKENEDEVAEQQAEEADTQHVVGDAMSQAMVQTPLAVLGRLMTTAGGPASAISLVRVLGRNLPLVLLLVMIGRCSFRMPSWNVQTQMRNLGPRDRMVRGHHRSKPASRFRRSATLFA